MGMKRLTTELRISYVTLLFSLLLVVQNVEVTWEIPGGHG